MQTSPFSIPAFRKFPLSNTRILLPPAIRLNFGLCTISQANPLCSSTMTKQQITTGTKGETPTTARLRIAPHRMVMMLSSGMRRPKDLRPEILMSINAIRKTATARLHIWSVSKFLPSPNKLVNSSMVYELKALSF